MPYSEYTLKIVFKPEAPIIDCARVLELITEEFTDGLPEASRGRVTLSTTDGWRAGWVAFRIKAASPLHLTAGENQLRELYRSSLYIRYSTIARVHLTMERGGHIYTQGHPDAQPSWPKQESKS